MGFSICRITTFLGTAGEMPPVLQGPPPPSSQPVAPGGAQRWHGRGWVNTAHWGSGASTIQPKQGCPHREGGRPVALSLTPHACGPASRRQPQQPGSGPAPLLTAPGKGTTVIFPQVWVVPGASLNGSEVVGVAEWPLTETAARVPTGHLPASCL